MSAKPADGAVNLQLPRDAALIPGKPFVLNLVIGDVLPGAALKLPTLR